MTSRASTGSAAVAFRVHHLGEERLIQRTPIDADAHGLVVGDRHIDDRAEVLIVALAADIAGIDPVLGEGARAHSG